MSADQILRDPHWQQAVKDMVCNYKYYPDAEDGDIGGEAYASN
jgi:hypothetical protein